MSSSKWSLSEITLFVILLPFLLFYKLLKIIFGNFFGKIGTIVMILLFIRLSVFQVIDTSMPPLISDKDIIFVNRLYLFTDLEKHDIVVMFHQGEFLITKIEKIGGEIVDGNELGENELYLKKNEESEGMIVEDLALHGKYVFTIKKAK